MGFNSGFKGLISQQEVRSINRGKSWR